MMPFRNTKPPVTGRRLFGAAALALGADDAAPIRDQRLIPPPRQLRAVGAAPPPARPDSTLTASTLFTRGPQEPGLASELRREIACADRVDVIMAFITVGGVRVLDDALAQLARAGGARGPNRDLQSRSMV